jgi:hypothetical protein
MRTSRLLAICVAFTASVGCGAWGSRETARTDEPNASAPTATGSGGATATERPKLHAAVVVQLGGSGDEWARGLAACPDGSVVVVTASGPPREDVRDLSWNYVVDPHDQPTVRVARVDPSGAIAWTRDASTTVAGTRVDVAGVACGPASVAVALRVAGGELEVAGARLGGSAVIVLGADGTHLRDVPLDGEARAVAVDADDAVVVAAAMPDRGIATVTAFTATGHARWSRSGPYGWGPAVAVGTSGDTVIGWAYHLEKVTTSGAVAWSSPMPRVGFVDAAGVADDGTVMTGGVFIGTATYADTTLHWDGPGWKAYLAFTDANGTPRSVTERDLGAASIAADRIAILAYSKVHENYPIPHQSICSQDLALLDAIGEERARRRVASCAGAGAGDAWWVAIAMARSGEIWVLGDAKLPFGIDARTLTPDHRDVFLVRFSP